MMSNTSGDGEEHEFSGRIGQKMTAAVRMVANSPAQSKKYIAERIGPYGSLQFGYQSVDRAIHRDLIEVDADHPAANPKGKGAVVITDRGRAFLDHEGDD